MEKGKVERACEIWNDLSRTNPNAPQLTYNIGLCHEISGDYEEALNLYGKATRLVKKPDDMFEDGIYRVRKKIAQGIQ